MADPTPAEELRAAAATVRAWVAAEPAAAWGPAAVAAFGPALTELLEHEAETAAADHLWAEREPCGWCGSPAGQHALAIAREILGGPR